MYVKNAANISFTNSSIIFFGRKRDLHIYKATFSELSQSTVEQQGNGVTSYFLYISQEHVSRNSFFCANRSMYEGSITVSSLNGKLL